MISAEHARARGLGCIRGLAIALTIYFVGVAVASLALAAMVVR